MARAARSVAAATVPEADAAEALRGGGERAVEQPEVAAHEWILAVGACTEHVRRFARRSAEAGDDGAKARMPCVAVADGQQRAVDELALGERQQQLQRQAARQAGLGEQEVAAGG